MRKFKTFVLVALLFLSASVAFAVYPSYSLERPKWRHVAPDFILGPPENSIYNHGAKTPTRLSNTANLYDRDTPYYDNAFLTVSITENNALVDRLVVIEDYQVKIIDNVTEKNVRINDISIGQVSGGDGFNPLVVRFNRFADHRAVEIVLDHVGYLNTSNDSSQSYRKINFVITNGEGGFSRNVTKTLLLNPGS